MEQLTQLEAAIVMWEGTKDPNRLPGGQTVQEWPDHVKNLHYALQQFIVKEREAGR